MERVALEVRSDVDFGYVEVVGVYVADSCGI